MLDCWFNRKNKLDSTYNPELYTVTERKGNEVTIQSTEGDSYRRNIAHVKKYLTPEMTDNEEVQSSDQNDVGPTDVQPTDAQSTDGPDDRMHPNHPDDATLSSTSNLTVPRRSSRVSHKPAYLKDFICGSE